MSKNETAATAEAAVEVKAKAKRNPPKDKPTFIVFNVLDENGQPMDFPKERINLIVATKSAAEALEVMDKGEFAHATYKSVLVKGR